MNADQIVEQMPAGFRWATADETEAWGRSRANHRSMVQVRVGGTDEEPWTDLAIRRSASDVPAPVVVPLHPPRCGPYCAIQHCACGAPADHGRKVCSKCARGGVIR